MSEIEQILTIAAACAAIITCAVSLREPIGQWFIRWYWKNHPKRSIWTVLIEDSEAGDGQQAERRRVGLLKHKRRVCRYRLYKFLQALIFLAVFSSLVYWLVSRWPITVTEVAVLTRDI